MDHGSKADHEHNLLQRETSTSKPNDNEKANTAPASSNNLVLLVLGDGDFSYSYDLARYLCNIKATNSPATTSILTSFPVRSKRLHLIATGLDSAKAVAEKYKDSGFLLKNLQALDNEDIGLKVSVHHGINAVQNNNKTTTTTSDGDGFLARGAHHVLFNHPHLGEENAALHSQFLCHLFHSVRRTWMVSTENTKDCNKKSFFHLTLVKGQYERWKCQKAAERNGMVLLCKHPFRSPQVVNQSSYYQHRRHQTGKSFAARTTGSEMYTFVPMEAPAANAAEKEADALLTATLFDLAAASDTNQRSSSSSQSSNTFPCPHCDKSFREERSRKNHIKSVHPDSADNGGGEGNKKRKHNTIDIYATSSSDTYACELCQSKEKTGPRLFKSARALEDHKKAKHTVHTVIQPDWHKKEMARNDDKVSGDDKSKEETCKSNEFGRCDVCGAFYTNEQAKKEHLKTFLPSDVTIQYGGIQQHVASLLPHKCSYCQKAFREERARKQHENFCSSRPSTD